MSNNKYMVDAQFDSCEYNDSPLAESSWEALDSPAKRFAFALLAGACWDLAGLIPSEKKDKGAQVSCARLARSWFLSERQEPASFLWVCDALEIEPERFRANLHRVAPVARSLKQTLARAEQHRRK